jgi:hypothetical protein
MNPITAPKLDPNSFYNETFLWARLAPSVSGDKLNVNVSSIDPNQIASPKCQTTRGENQEELLRR